ncbi:hypothetical protein GCM10027430_13140 [Lysobacter tyrosinilyticus]
MRGGVMDSQSTTPNRIRHLVPVPVVVRVVVIVATATPIRAAWLRIVRAVARAACMDEVITGRAAGCQIILRVKRVVAACPDSLLFVIPANAGIQLFGKYGNTGSRAFAGMTKD